MATASLHPTATAPAGWLTFRRAWRASAFATAMCGFAALWITGEIPFPAATIFVAGWSLALALPQPPAWWRPWMGRVGVGLALLAIGHYALQFKFVSILYLVMFLALYKCFVLRQPIDHLHILLLAFFMFLACSIITTRGLFVLCLFAFVALAWVELTFLTMARDASAGEPGGGSLRTGGCDPAPLRGGGPFVRRLLRGGVGYAAGILVLAFGLFFVMPHYSTPGVPSPLLPPPTPETKSVGYSDGITLDAFDSLEPNETEVLRLAMQRPWYSPGPLPPQVHLRGLALDYFDGRQWSRPQTRELNSIAWRSVPLPVLTAYHGGVLEQSITQDVSIAQRLFGAGVPFHFDFSNVQVTANLAYWQPGRGGPIMTQRFMLNLDWSAQALQVPAPPARRPRIPGWLNYRVNSFVGLDALPLLSRLADAAETLPSPSDDVAVEDTTSWTARLARMAARIAGWRPDQALVMDARTRQRYTQLPPGELTDTLRRVAAERMTAPNVPARIVQLYAWFQNHFTYSLKPGTPRGMNPIEAFLTRTHRGHCEYFATAMALLLRAEGIPARVATGFYGWEWNEDRSVMIVRQSDAHAWVEVWLDGWGWLTLDPTPRDMRGRAAYRVRDEDSLWRRTYLAARQFWQQNVVDFTSDRQRNLWTVLVATDFLQFLQDVIHPLAATLAQTPSPGEDELADPAPWSAQWWREVGMIALALGGGGWLTARRLRARARRGPVWDRPAVGFMDHLLRRLARLGWRRRPGQTVAELVAEIERAHGDRWPLRTCVDLYYRYRFGGQARDRLAEAQAWAAIRQLK